MGDPQRGDIYHIDVLQGEIQGHEFCGPHAWVVISIGEINAQLKLFTAVPLTSIINKSTGREKDLGAFRYFRKRILATAKISDAGVNSTLMQGESLALPEQIRVFSTLRITEPRLGVMTPIGLGAIELGLAFVQGRGVREMRTAIAPLNTSEAPAAPKFVMPQEPARLTPGMPASSKP